MKHQIIILGALLIAFSNSGFSATYKCYRYADNVSQGSWVKVLADSKKDAEGKAYMRMKENIGYGKVDYAKCEVDATPPLATQTCPKEDEASERFKVHDNGTATDTKTGLMWKKCSEGQTGTDCTGGSASTYTWRQALQQGDAANYAGHSDWRLPTIDELETILKSRCRFPAIDLSVFPNTPPVRYWSSPIYPYKPEHAWRSDFNAMGGRGGSSITDRYAVRLVRDSQPQHKKAPPLDCDGRGSDRPNIGDVQGVMCYLLAVPKAIGELMDEGYFCKMSEFEDLRKITNPFPFFEWEVVNSKEFTNREKKREYFGEYYPRYAYMLYIKRVNHEVLDENPQVKIVEEPYESEYYPDVKRKYVYSDGDFENRMFRMKVYFVSPSGKDDDMCIVLD